MIDDHQTYLRMFNELRGLPLPLVTLRVRMVLNSMHVIPLRPSKEGDGVYVDGRGRQHRAISILHACSPDEDISYVFFVPDHADVMRAFHVLTLGRDAGVLLVGLLGQSHEVLLNPLGRPTQVGIVSETEFEPHPSKLMLA